MRLDHLSYAAVPDQLVDVAQQLGDQLGVTPVDGGVHPRFGTRNRILPLGAGHYVEVVAALDHPAADRVPFGQAVRARADAGGGWLGWVVAVDDISPLEARLGREAVSGHRVRPDGIDLTWRQIGVKGLLHDPQLPFFVQWDCEQQHHPSQGGGAVVIERLELAGDPDRIEEWMGAPTGTALEDVDVDWVTASEVPGLRSATFTTAGRTVTI